MIDPGTLYVVATPIGNLSDLSHRAEAVLRAADVIAAEDTRFSRKLTTHLEISGSKLVSCHDHNERSRAPWLVEQLRAGRVVALISDAGTPLVSDPGFAVVRAVIEAGLPVVPVPGPSAALAALVASGLPPDRFLFLGFLPRTGAKRRAALAEVRASPCTVIAYEAQQRLHATLADVLDVLGDRQLAAASNLTKRGERVLRGSVSEVAAQLAAEERGEWTLVVAGAPEAVADWGPADVLIDELLARGLSSRDVRDVVATTFGLPRGEVYERVMARAG